MRTSYNNHNNYVIKRTTTTMNKIINMHTMLKPNNYKDDDGANDNYDVVVAVLNIHI